MSYYHKDLNKYMNMPMGQWPESLKDTCKTVSDRIGWCMDVCAETINDWLKAGQVELMYGGEDGFDLVPRPTKPKYTVYVTSTTELTVEADSEEVAGQIARDTVNQAYYTSNESNVHPQIEIDETWCTFIEEMNDGVS